MSDLPWFRFFPSDWLAGTRGMSAVETGIYITLIATMYEHGHPIPDDRKRLARLCGASVSAFNAALDCLVDQGKISIENGCVWNERVAKEVNFRAEKSDAAQKNAKARWGKKSNKNNGHDDANAMRMQCENDANQKPYTRIDDTVAIATVSPEPEKSAPVAVLMPVTSGPDFPILESDVAEWAEAFPAIDIRQQLLAMRAWLNANPTRRKTTKGVKRFVVSWLDREQNKGRPQARQGHAPPPQQQDSFRDAIRALAGTAHEPDHHTTGHRNTGNGSPDRPGDGIVIDLLAFPGKR